MARSRNGLSLTRLGAVVAGLFGACAATFGVIWLALGLWVP